MVPAPARGLSVAMVTRSGRHTLHSALCIFWGEANSLFNSYEHACSGWSRYSSLEVPTASLVGRSDLPAFYATKAKQAEESRAEVQSTLRQCCAFADTTVADGLQGVGSMGGATAASFSLRVTRQGGCVATLLTQGADWRGGDVAFVKAATVAECLGACTEEPRCSRFTFLGSTASCWMKDDNAELVDGGAGLSAGLQVAAGLARGEAALDASCCPGSIAQGLRRGIAAKATLLAASDGGGGVACTL